MKKLTYLLFSLLLTACAMPNTNTRADSAGYRWYNIARMEMKVIEVNSADQLRQYCGEGPAGACFIRDKTHNVCWVFLYDRTLWAHEKYHCDGYNHQ